MFIKAVFPGKYIQGSGAIRELPALVEMLGQRGLILASPSVMKKVLPSCGLDLGTMLLADTFRGECSESELARLSDLISDQRIEVMVGMGGGKTIDAAKIAADRAHIPVIVVPTIASTDAPCSGCAVVYSDQGAFERVLYQRMNPAAVLVDLDIIAAAPPRFLVAGMGDALATWFEARSCNRTGSPNECGGLSTEVGLHIAKLCYETLLAHGAAAKADNERGAVTTSFSKIVEANILMSGLGFESGGLASAHAIHNGLTALEETHPFYHGEKVAFGLLSGLHLTDADAKEMRAAYLFCEKVGLPTTLADIGLDGVARDRLMVAAERACGREQPIHHEGSGITPERVLRSMLAADAMGRAMRSSADR